MEWPVASIIYMNGSLVNSNLDNDIKWRPMVKFQMFHSIYYMGSPPKLYAAYVYDTASIPHQKGFLSFKGCVHWVSGMCTSYICLFCSLLNIHGLKPRATANLPGPGSVESAPATASASKHLPNLMGKYNPMCRPIRLTQVVIIGI